MPNRGDRGGSRTRARISAVATEMFLERGFEDVTIADVARGAGVSKVTVFAHFERKEDLVLDRLPDAVEIVRSAVADRPDGVDPVEAIRRAVTDLAAEGHVLSCLSEGAGPYMRVFFDSPALVARLRTFEHEIEQQLAGVLDADPAFTGDAALTAALVVAAYRTVAVDTVRRRLAGTDLADVAAAHRRRLDEAFDAVANGVRSAAVSPTAAP